MPSETGTLPSREETPESVISSADAGARTAAEAAVSAAAQAAAEARAAADAQAAAAAQADSDKKAAAQAQRDAEAQGAQATCTVQVADKAGNPLCADPRQAANPSDPRARQLVFDLHIAAGGASPTTSELSLMREITRIEHALQELYCRDSAEDEARFRQFFVRLFYIAQLALEGDVVTDAMGKIVAVGGRLSDEAAKAEVKAIAADLIDDEAPRVKSRHLRDLAQWAGVLGVPALLAYGLLSLAAPAGSSNAFVVALERLHVVPAVAANFMLLWVGTMVGVCLSYAFRTTEFTIADLTKTDSDHLPPTMRLAITGALAALLVLFTLAGLGDVAIGASSLSSITDKPMLAIVVGAVLGIGEQQLSGTVAKKAGDLFGGVK